MFVRRVIEMAFAGSAANHQRADRQGTREKFSQPKDPFLRGWAGALQQVLVEKKEGLNGSNLAGGVFQHEIAIVEALENGVFDDFVIPAILAAIGKRLLPWKTVVDVAPLGNICGAVRSADARQWESVGHKHVLVRREPAGAAQPRLVPCPGRAGKGGDCTNRPAKG